MKVEEYDGRQEREILIAMITSPAVVARIAARWDEKLFASQEANTIGGWCVQHHRKYNEAPKHGIGSYFREWSECIPDKAQSEIVGKLLASLSAEMEQSPEIVNPEHAIEVAARRFNRVRLDRLADDIKADLKAGKINRADERAASYSKVEMGVGAGIDLFIDEEAIRSTFAEELTAPLITFPGPIGSFFAGTLVREGFVAFWGAQKVGKSHWLSRLAWQAMLQRKRVVYFQIGDMPEQEIKERFMMLAARRPKHSPNIDERNQEIWPCTLDIPTAVRIVDGEPQVDIEQRTYKRPLNGDRALLACQKVMQNEVRSKRSYFKLYSFPTATVATFKSTLEECERVYNWVPDICIIDYADNVQATDKRLDQRDQINSVWQSLRNLALERHCLVLTASQIKTEGFTANVLDRRHFADDNRKLNHVTALVGINTTDAEKEHGITRLNWIIKRSGPFSVRRQWYAVGHFGIANPCIVSAHPAPPPKKEKSDDK